MGNEQSNQQSHQQSVQESIILPTGIKRVSSTLQKLYTSPIINNNRINIRILIRGDRSTGKSVLFSRLEGNIFIDEHYPTPEIKVTHIPWNFKTSDEIVKVEIWDVVDSALKTSDIPNLLLHHGDNNLKIDATTVDLYRGCNAVLILVDPSRKWTFEYASNLIKEIPGNIEIVAMVNFMDLASRHVMLKSDITAWANEQPRKVRCIYTSLKDCYGLYELSNYINIPYIAAKKAIVAAQLASIEEEYQLSCLETDTILTNQNYENFLQRNNTISKESNLPRLSTSSEEIIKRSSLSPRKVTQAVSPVTILPTLKEVVESEAKLPTFNVGLKFNNATENDQQDLKSDTKMVDIDSFKIDSNTSLDDFFGDDEPVVTKKSISPIKVAPVENRLISPIFVKEDMLPVRYTIATKINSSESEIKISKEVKPPKSDLNSFLDAEDNKSNPIIGSNEAKSALESFFDDEDSNKSKIENVEVKSVKSNLETFLNEETPSKEANPSNDSNLDSFLGESEVVAKYKEPCFDEFEEEVKLSKEEKLSKSKSKNKKR